MEQRVSLITLGVSNVERAKAFYESLGWTAAFSNAQIAFFQLNGLLLGLFDRTGLNADMARENVGPGAVALAYNVRDKTEVAPLLEEAKAAGGAILKPAEDVSWGGHSGYFADPDGHAWEVAWNPGWRISEDGSVHLGA